jgi:hypothetical protein
MANGVLGPEQRRLEPVEEGCLALFGHPPLEPVEGAIEHSQGPAAVVQPLGRLDVGRFTQVPGLRPASIERDDRNPTAPLDPLLAGALMAEVALERRQQERPEPTPRGVNGPEETAGQPIGEKTLGQVLGLLGS